MKYQSICLVALFSFLFINCSPKTPELATVTGKVSVNWSNKVNLRQGTISLAESWSGQKDHRDSFLPIQEDGTFAVAVPLNEPLLFSISHEQKQVEFILSPNDSLHINLTTDAVFSGTSALENNHITKMNQEIRKIERFITSDEKTFFGASLDRYNQIVDSLESAYLKVHDDFKKDQKLPQVFDEKVNNEIKYRSLFHKIVYPSIHEMYTGDTLAINQQFFDKITEGSFDNPKLLESANYVLFLERYVDIMSAGDLRFRNFYDAGIQKIQPKYDAIKNLKAHQDIKDYLMNEHLKKSISNYGVAYLGGVMSDFQDSCQDQFLKDQVLEIYEKGKKRREQPNEIKVYKTIGDIELEAHIFYPENHQKGDQTSAYVFFHGGGWAVGIPEWGYKNCQRYQDKGMVAISIEYRLLDIHGGNIINCIEDVNSAILWVRQQATELGIDPNKVVAAGFSAGGHLATSTATLDEFTLSENGFNSKPNALVVHSASYNTTKSSFFRRQSNGKPESISTFHNAKKRMPPAIFFHGTKDHLAPMPEFTEFRDKMESLNNDFEYKIFQDVGHFFNDPKASEEVRELTDQFLQKLGYIL
jgi:acetyl esterase/lipase